jgi:hypothetical protein
MDVDRLTALSAIGVTILAPQVGSAETLRRPNVRPPLRVTIDYEPTHPAVYVYYVPDDQAQRAYSTRIGDTIVVDTNSIDELVGLELLDMSAETLKTARSLAAEHGASFPAHLRAV